MTLPVCHSRRELVSQPGHFFCAHPQVNAEGQIVTADVCQLCARWREPAPTSFRPFEQPTRALEPDARCAFLGNATGWRQCTSCRGNVRLRVFECQHPWHNSTTLGECRNCRDFQPSGASRYVTTWSVGVTTAPRRQPTLAECLASLRDAGWNRPHVFAEPGVDLPAGFEELPFSRRHATLGAFPNWYLALTEMFFSAPQVEAYFLCQDDVIFAQGLRDYLEWNLWPAPEVGVVSVYCPSHYAVGRSPGFCVEDYGDETWGALAYIFSNPSVRRFLAHPLPLDHRHHGRRKGLRQIDGIVGAWCRAEQLPYFVHNPSLAQHIGETSTLGSSPNRAGRRADRFLSDARGLLPPPAIDAAAPPAADSRNSDHNRDSTL